ncbi:MAG: nitroreductase family protein [bacterium]|nr:nitroreductase family protein [bacterium]
MKKFLKLCEQRFSVRKYASRKVPRKLILQCLEAARIAPSAENFQPWRYMVVDEEPLLTGLKNAATNTIYFLTRWAHTAPVIIVLLARTDLAVRFIGPVFKGLDYYLLDLGIGTEQLVLEAADLGLGTCWIGWFNVGAVEKLLKIPKKYKLIGLLTLGYPDKNLKAHEKRRKKMEEIAWFNEIK